LDEVKLELGWVLVKSREKDVMVQEEEWKLELPLLKSSFAHGRASTSSTETSKTSKTISERSCKYKRDHLDKVWRVTEDLEERSSWFEAS
jgi:hypothetical protein